MTGVVEIHTAMLLEVDTEVEIQGRIYVVVAPGKVRPADAVQAELSVVPRNRHERRAQAARLRRR